MTQAATIDEGPIVAAARKGDRAAFGALVKAYQRRAYAAAYGIVGNRDDALDLAQESFVRAYRAMHRFDPAMPFYPWLHQIVRNTCLNHLKRKKRRGEQSLDEMMEQGYDAREEDPSASEAMQQDDIKRQVAAAMTQLSMEHREILRLRHMMDLSYAEIASMLNIPIGTVMSRLHAARKALKKVIEAESVTTEPTP
jgi:RNA polymerase sigma-70 factor (ECF subfamily)